MLTFIISKSYDLIISSLISTQSSAVWYSLQRRGKVTDRDDLNTDEFKAWLKQIT